MPGTEQPDMSALSKKHGLPIKEINWPTLLGSSLKTNQNRQGWRMGAKMKTMNSNMTGAKKKCSPTVTKSMKRACLSSPAAETSFVDRGRSDAGISSK